MRNNASTGVYVCRFVSFLNIIMSYQQQQQQQQMKSINHDTSNGFVDIAIIPVPVLREGEVLIKVTKDAEGLKDR